MSSSAPDTRVHEVDYHKWCPTCAHYELDEKKDPCHDCLNQGWNVDSRKPIHWEEVNAYESGQSQTS